MDIILDDSNCCACKECHLCHYGKSRFSLEGAQNTSAISIRRNFRIHKILILTKITFQRLCNFSEKRVRQKILDYSNDDVGNEIEEVLYDLALSTSICWGF